MDWNRNAGDVGVDVFLFQMHSLAKKNVKIVG